MAGYEASSLVRLGSAPFGTTIDKANSVYLYPTLDAWATVIAAGYFNNARGRLKKGDTVIVVSDAAGSPAVRALTLASVPSAGNVTTAKASNGLGGLTPLTAATGVTGDTVADVGGAFNQATLNNNFKVLADKINAILGA